MTASATPSVAGRRIGAIASIVSATNILLFAAVGLGLAAINSVHPVVRVPAGYFILFASVLVAVVLVTWPQANRSVPAALGRAPGFSLSSGMLTALAFFGSIWVYSVVRMYDSITTVFGPYAVAGWLCLIAGGLAYVRGQFDPPVVTALTPLLTRVPDPSRPARVLSAISAIAFAAMLLFCVLLIPVEQLVYLTAHGGALPPGHGGAEALWNRSLPLPIPPAVFWLQPAVLATIFVASFWRSNRWIPTTAFAGLRAVTPLRLSLLAIVSGFVQLPVLFYLQPIDEGTPEYYGGVIILFLVFAVGVVASRWVVDTAPMKRGKRPRGAPPLLNVGKLPQVDVATVAGWVNLPSRFPTDGYANATAWVTGMLPRLGAEIGTGTQGQKHDFSRALVSLINSRLRREMGRLFLLLEEWEGPYLVAGMAFELSQPWLGMPVNSLGDEIALEDRRPTGQQGAHPDGQAPLTSFTTTSGLEGHRRGQPGRVDYWISVEGGWAHLSCEDAPARIAASLTQLDALAAAVFLGDRVVGRRKKKPVAASE